MYLRTVKTLLMRRTPLGTFACFPYGFRFETFFPTLEVDELSEELLKLCDGTRTRDDILQQLAEMSGEPVEEIAEGFDEFVEYMVGEGILKWVEKPSFIEPLYKEDRPLAVTIDITSACNLHCPMCAVSAGAARPDDLTLDDIAVFIEQAKKYKPSPLAISGGEPLLKKEMLLYMMEELSPIEEIALSVFTNGTLVTKDYAQQLYDAGMRIARVSLDGHNDQVHDSIRGKGAFAKTIQGIENFKEVGIHVDAVSTISKMNYQYVGETMKLCSQIADTWGFTPVVPIGRADMDLALSPEETFHIKVTSTDPEKISTNVSPRTRCQIGEDIYIRANGDIFPCFYTQVPEFKVGNIRESDLSEIYKTDIMQDMLKLTVDDVEGCKECDIRYLCAGGCRGYAYLSCGSLYVPDAMYCDANKITASRILESGEENTKKLLEELIKSTKELH